MLINLYPGSPGQELQRVYKRELHFRTELISKDFTEAEAYEQDLKEQSEFDRWRMRKKAYFTQRKEHELETYFITLLELQIKYEVTQIGWRIAKQKSFWKTFKLGIVANEK